MKRRRKVIIAAIALVSLYLLLCGLVYFFQEVMLFPGAYRPAGKVAAPANVRLEKLRTESGLEFRVAVSRPSGTARGVLVYFLGNGEDLRSGVYHAAVFAEYGLWTMVAEYPGYGESEGKPGLDSILAAADALGAEGLDRARGLDLPLFVGGHSLGTFSAVHLAVQGVGRRMLLTAPPTTIAKTGQRHYPFLPVGLLIRHRFDNSSKAPDVAIPTLILHGDADGIVPTDMGRDLADAIPGAKFMALPNVGHNNVDLSIHGPAAEAISAHLFR